MVAAIYDRILLTLFCLLAVATSASAECAWVLWGGTYRIPDSYAAYQAFESKRECFTTLEEEVGKVHPSNRLSFRDYYACWPVGVDPTRVTNPKGYGQQGNPMRPTR